MNSTGNAATKNDSNMIPTRVYPSGNKKFVFLSFLECGFMGRFYMTLPHGIVNRSFMGCQGKQKAAAGERMWELSPARKFVWPEPDKPLQLRRKAIMFEVGYKIID